MFKVKIRKCEALRDGLKLIGTNGIFQKKLLSLKVLHYCIKPLDSDEAQKNEVLILKVPEVITVKMLE